MKIIKSKRTLNSKIKQILENNLEDKIEFPCELTFCEGMGEPVFKISIEKAKKTISLMKKVRSGSRHNEILLELLQS